MAHFLKPLTAGKDGYKVSKGSLESMTVPAKAGKNKRQVVVWGGGNGGEVLSLKALSHDGDVIAKTRLIGVEPGHKAKSDGSHKWFMLYEVEGTTVGCGTLRAVDSAGGEWARIDLSVSDGGAKKAVILVPSQGAHNEMFKNVAIHINKKLYGGGATIIKTTVSKTGRTITLHTLDGKAFTWSSVSGLSSVVTISHGGCDGPNLAMLDDDVYTLDHQALGGDHADTCGELTAASKAFWQSVSKSMVSCGKIILMGCSMADYARKAVKAAQRRMYAFEGACAAANPDVTERYVKAIENGAVLKPMIEAKP